jgi:hypothetical protein
MVNEERTIRKRIITETSNDETQSGVKPRALGDNPKKKKKSVTSPPSEEEKENENENRQDSQQQPTNPTDAFRNLGKTTVEEFKNRGTDIVNGSTGMVKMMSRKTKAIGDLMGKQMRNVEDVTIDGIRMVSDAGDGLTRGTRHVMNSTKELAKEGGSQAYEGLRAITGLTKSTTKMAGTAINSPMSMAGDWIGVGRNAFAIPMRFSRTASTQINKRLFGDNENQDDDKQENKEEENEEEEKPKPKTKRTNKK